jgi:hypothetical protein
MDTRIELSFRDRAILRAVAGGRAELLVGVEPDLYLDGRFCADQVAAHRLARAGLIVAAAPGTTAHRVPACLTATGRRHALGAWSPCPATASGDDQPAGRLQPIRRLAVTATGGETTSDYDFVAVSEVAAALLLANLTDVVTSALDAGAFIVLTPLPYASDISRFAESDGRQARIGTGRR